MLQTCRGSCYKSWIWAELQLLRVDFLEPQAKTDLPVDGFARGRALAVMKAPGEGSPARYSTGIQVVRAAAQDAVKLPHVGAALAPPTARAAAGATHEGGTGRGAPPTYIAASTASWGVPHAGAKRQTGRSRLSSLVQPWRAECRGKAMLALPPRLL